MENNSWISLYRKLQDEPFWLSEKFTKAQAWIDLLLTANYSQSELTIGYKTVTIKRGQILVSQVNLAKRWQWHRETVGKYLKYLKSVGWIDYYTDRNMKHGYTVISIQKYEKLQGNQQQDRQVNRQQNVSKTDTYNKVNKNNKYVHSDEKKRQVAWETYAPAYMKVIGISEPNWIAECRENYLKEASANTQRAVEAFIQGYKRRNAPDTADYVTDLWEGVNE